MIEQGRILDVTEENTGSELIADAPVGATVLSVQDAYDFNKDGGSLDLNGTVLAYLSADADTDTITLASPLVIAAFTEDPVLVYPYGLSKVALVDLYDQDDAQRAIVPFGLTAALDVGIRDTAEQEQVFIDDSHGRWEVAALDEEIPGYNGAYIVPGTLPDTGGEPTDPPEGSPALKAYGTLDAIILRSEDVEASTSIQYHISRTDGFTPDSTTLLPGSPTRSLVYVATADASGNPLEMGVDYYFRAVAENIAGEAAPGLQVGPVQLDPSNASSVFAEEVVAGFVLTGRIQVGVSYLDADEGLVMPQPDGGTITMPVDGLTPAQITAYLIAKSLTVQNDLIIQGTGTIRGQMSMSQGVSNPTTLPTINAYWPSVQSVLGDGFIYTGLCEHNSTTFATTIAFFGANIRLFDKATGAFVSDAATGKSWTNNFLPLGGITKVGTKFYVLGQDAARDSDWYLYEIDGTTFDKTGEVGGWTYPNTPSVGNDGTNILIAWVGDSNNLRVRTVTIGTWANSSVVVDTVTSGQSSAWYAAQFVGQGGYGDATSRLYIKLGGWGTVRAYAPSTFVRDGSRDFIDAGSTLKGMCYDTADSAMASFDNTGALFKYGTYTVQQNYNAAYTWYDGNSTGGTHETAASTVKTLVDLRPRSYLKIETPPAPDVDDSDPTHTDKANQIRIYASAASNPVRLQTTLAVGTRTATFKGNLATATAPPATNGFSGIIGGSSMGRFYSSGVRTVSGLPRTDIWGDGTGRLDAICPPGTIFMWPTTTVPDGFLLCNGATFSSVTYPDLAAVLGDAFGTHSGTSYFLPDFQGRFPIGYNPAAIDFGDHIGDSEGDNAAGRDLRFNHAHTHSISGQSPDPTPNSPGSASGNVPRHQHYSGHAHGGATGSSSALPSGTVHPYMTINFIIKT